MPISFRCDFIILLAIYHPFTACVRIAQVAAGRFLDRVPLRLVTYSLASPIFEGQDILGLLSETESSSERIYERRRADSMYDSVHEGSSRGGVRVITQS